MERDGERGAFACSLGRGNNELLLEVVERNGDDFILEGRVKVRHFSAAAACNASLEELLAWQAQLASLHETLTGEARLRQPGFVITLTGGGDGRVTVEGEFDSESGWGGGERAVLHFALPSLDQTDVPDVIHVLEAAAAMPPTAHDVE